MVKVWFTGGGPLDGKTLQLHAAISRLPISGKSSRNRKYHNQNGQHGAPGEYVNSEKTTADGTVIYQWIARGKSAPPATASA